MFELIVIIVIAVVLILIGVWAAFNGLVKRRNRTQEAWSQIDVELKIATAENALSGALRSLFAVAENYPQLRAVESFLQLQEALTSTEDKIEYARRYYNTSVRDYNIGLQTFPRRLIADLFNFKPAAFFAAQDEDRAVPALSLSSFAAPASGVTSPELPSTDPESPTQNG
jgi:LemA protein